MADVLSPVKTLRAAADRLRELASPVPPGPWRDNGMYGGVVATPTASHPKTDGYNGHLLGESMSEAVRAYVTSWPPAVALTLADWLDAQAEDLAIHVAAWTHTNPGEDDTFFGRAARDPKRLAHLTEDHSGKALAVARKLLGVPDAG